MSSEGHEQERVARCSAERRRLLEAALAAIDVGVLAVDGEGRLVSANEAARQLAEQLTWLHLQVGKRLIEPPWRHADGRAMPPDATPLARALRGEETADILALVRRGDGSDASIQISARPLRNDEGRVAGAVLVLRDVSQRVAAERETPELADALRQANERLLVSTLAAQEAAEREQAARAEAEAAVRARDQFLAAASHGLKTPVINMRGFAQLTLRRLARDPALDPEQVRRALEVINQQAERLDRLVSWLLDVSLIGEEGLRLRLRRQETDLAALARRVASAQTNGGRHRFVVQAPAEVSAVVDRERLEQVLTNLLDNAREHSPADPPSEIQLSTPDPQTVCIAVRDYGPGIPPEERRTCSSATTRRIAARP